MAKQNIFETQQRAEELLQQAIHMWKLSDKSDALEGLEEDPVFKLIFSAIAYQSNEIESQIAGFKEEILKEFQEMVFVNEGNSAIPATVVITTKPAIATSVRVDDRMQFIMHASKQTYNFLPLLKTNIFKTHVSTVNRLDGRRWLVSLDFEETITSLEGFSFTMKDCNFHDLKITLAHNAQDLPLIAPWDYDKLPLSNSFSLNTLIYNRQQASAAGNSRSFLMPYYRNCAMTLFAKQNLQYYIVDRMSEIEPTNHIDLLLEFDGIDENFNFNANLLSINTVILVNAKVETVTLSKQTPMVRAAGSNGDSAIENQFMHLLSPNEDQMLGKLPVQVRRVYADRFNQGKLIKLLNELISKYSSDFYAFQEFGVNTTNLNIKRIRQSLNDLIHESNNHNKKEIEGVYLILTNKALSQYEDLLENDHLSMDVKYLLTSGAFINEDLNKNSTLTHELLDGQKTRQITDPILGVNEMMESSTELAISKYFTTTEDVLVTPADIKLFCISELVRHYGITKDLINDIRIGHKMIDTGHFHSYAITVKISIKKTMFTQRFFTNKITGVELYIEKMIGVRTNGLYPIRVNLVLN